MVKIPDLKEMIKAGVHFGHQTSKWYPKMKPFIFTQKDGIHIIDLTKTTEHLKIAADFAQKVAANGDKILFIGIKKQAQPIVKRIAQECGMPYMSGKWIGGLLTNFSVTTRSIKRYKILLKKKAEGELGQYTKKEQSDFDKEIVKLEQKVGGIVEMDRFPQAIFLLDMKKSQTALAEARRKKLPIIAICDTNCNPELVDYPIPGNDDSVKSVELLVSVISEAVKEGKKQQVKEAAVKPVAA